MTFTDFISEHISTATLRISTVITGTLVVAGIALLGGIALHDAGGNEASEVAVRADFSGRNDVLGGAYLPRDLVAAEEMHARGVDLSFPNDVLCGAWTAEDLVEAELYRESRADASQTPIAAAP